MGQNKLISIKDPASVTLTLDEQATFLALQDTNQAIAVWHINLAPIEQFIQGNALSIQLPNVSGNLTFNGHHAWSIPGQYYWAGANANGSSFSLGKYPTGYLGKIYVAPTQSFYTIQNLGSSSKLVLVERPKKAMGGECAVLPVPDEDTDNSVGDRSNCENNTIRVLFLFTTTAAASPSGLNPLTVAPMVITELNGTIPASGLTSSDVTFVLAGTALLPGFSETFSISNDFIALLSNPIANTLRNSTSADIVVLLTDDYPGNIVGISRQGALASSAFGLVPLTSAAGSMSATHEIGHIIGARHQRCAICNWQTCDNMTNAHGYAAGGFSTVMYLLPCEIPRVGVWSNINVPFMGHAMGTPVDNNAKIIKDRAGKVACFRQIVPGLALEVFLKGSPSVCDGDDDELFSATYDPAAFLPPVTVIWEVSENGVGPWTIQSCTGNQCTITGINNLPNEFFVRIRVMDATGNFASDMIRVKKVNCRSGSFVTDRSDEQSTAPFDLSIQVAPQPALDHIDIRGGVGVADLMLVDVKGKIILRQQCNLSMEGPERLDLSSLPSGFYQLWIKQQNQTVKKKIVKL